jgi:mRNA interferase MazF
MVNQRSIILVPFPYSDQSGSKVRPALVLSNDHFNKHDDVIICALTSNIKERPYTLTITAENTVQKKLKDRSQIRLETVTRLKKELIVKEIDSIDENTFKKALDMFYTMFT